MISIQDISWPEFKAMRSDWKRLHNRSPVDPLFLDWRWVSGWWKHFSSENNLSFRGIVLRDSSNSVIGLVPFVIWQAYLKKPVKIERMQLLGNLHAGPNTMRTEYNDLLIEPSCISEACAALVQHLLTSPSWRIQAASLIMM